jgi:Porin subfamily
MLRQMADSRPMLYAAALALTAALALVSTAVLAQTLTDPNPPAKWSLPAAPARSHPAARLKSCSAYGDGFVNVPGTDTCIKVGGWAEVEGSARP